MIDPLLIISITGLVAGIALLTFAKIMKRNRVKYLATRETHPAE